MFWRNFCHFLYTWPWDLYLTFQHLKVQLSCPRSVIMSSVAQSSIVKNKVVTSGFLLSSVIKRSVVKSSVVFLSVFATLAFLSLANLASSSFFSINKISLRSLPTPCKYRVSKNFFPNLESNYESNTVKYYIRGNFLTRLIHCITHNTFCQLIISHKFNNNLLLLQNFFSSLL